MASAPARALELGEPEVRSHLGQPLEVVVPYLTGGNERLGADCVSLVRGEAAGLPVMTGARVISAANGRLVIRGSHAIRDPLLAMHLKVDCPATPFLVRAYAIIVDPAELHPSRPVPVRVAARHPAGAGPEEAGGDGREASSSPGSPGNRGVASGDDVRAGAAPRASARQESLVPGTTYRVRAGDTLYSIATRVAGRTTGVRATAQRLFAANPGAFVDGDMDRLLAGATLTITDGRVTPAQAATNRKPEGRLGAEPAGIPSVPDPQPTDTGREGSGSVPVIAWDFASHSIESAAKASGASADPVTSSPFEGEEAIEQRTAPGTPIAQTVVPQSAGSGSGTQDTGAGTWSAGTASGAALGVALGLLFGLAMFRSSIRGLFRRSASPAAADTGTTPDLHPDAEAMGFFAGIADEPNEPLVDNGPALIEEESDLLVTEENWADIDQSRLKSLDLDLDFDADDDAPVDATAEEPVASHLSLGDGEDSSGPLPAARGPTEATAEERFEESMIVEVDTGAELAAGTSADEWSADGQEAPEDTGLATAMDLQMLEEDYEHEFTATQRLEKQLADAALELDREISAHADGDDAEDTLEEPLVATATQRSA
ncbi:MAG: LysM peptidoglycan-binding domain-containing protein [Gammaproteobacteria bacterium]